MKLALAITCVAGMAQAQDISVPSGVAMTLFDVLIEDAPPVARFRFVVPDIAIAGAAVPFAEVVGDIQYLCDTVAKPALMANGWTAGDVVVSLSAQEVPFGEPAADVTQYFQPFRLEGDTCIWEDF